MPTPTMLKARLRSGLLMSAALLVAAFLVPPWGVWLIVAGVTILGLREFYRLLEIAEIPSFKIVGSIAAVALITGAWLTHGAAAVERRLDGEALALFAGMAAVFARMLFQRGNPRPLETMAGTLMGVWYIGYLMCFFLRIALAWGGVEGRWLLIYLIFVVKMSDIGAYFIGCRFGRHKLLPRISPAKSWEGLWGGLAFALAASFAAYSLFDGRLGPLRVRALDAAVLGVLLTAFGVFGDLLESLLKRAAGVKDSGTMIEGMGGILDVIDSLLPAAPALYFYARLFLEPVATGSP